VTNILAFLFVLGVLIFVHELGHFIMARRIGVRVLTFSLGFGPKLLSFRRGDTEYRVSVIPLGGYVKMAGETSEDVCVGATDEFLTKTKWQRFQVLVMGPLMNLALAVVVMALVLYQGAEVPAFGAEPVVVGMVANGSPAQASGIVPGDRIVLIDGVEVPDWERFSIAIADRVGRSADLAIERNGRVERVQIVPGSDEQYGVGNVGVFPVRRPQILSVTSRGPAAEAGLQSRDVILAIDGERSPTKERVYEVIRAHENRPLAVEIEREGRLQMVTVTPRLMGDAPRIAAYINPFEVRTVKVGAVGALTMSVERNWEWSKTIVRTLAGLFTGASSVKELMGPVAIAEVSGDAASQGWVQLFSLMALISLNLGLLNLMPIPVLDGGHIAILATESISRRDFSIRVKEKMLLAGSVVLIVLMATVIYNDLTRVEWIGRLMPWR
jgi:regulator of sigma E protease